MNDSNKRSLIKTVTWRIVGSGATLLIAWFMTDNITAASSIAAVQLVLNTILYYVHERTWNLIKWGRNGF
jgi:uncharacterized membrane protein